jgi:triosephosphate isomerase
MTTCARERIAAGNWKMNGSLAANQTLLLDFLEKSQSSNISATCIVFPPFVYLSQIAALLEKSNVKWGAQNISQYEGPGAFTGEISPAMLKDFGCQYTLVGHSERRTLFGETPTIVAEKFNLAKKHQLTPILCVGETLAEREAGRAEEVLAEQLAVIDNFDNSIIAYEPVWAIGTGVTATPEQAQTMHAFIRQYVAKQNATVANKISILYGGSVKASNAEALFAMPDIDGALVGGASLNADEFLAIATA